MAERAMGQYLWLGGSSYDERKTLHPRDIQAISILTFWHLHWPPRGQVRRIFIYLFPNKSHPPTEPQTEAGLTNKAQDHTVSNMQTFFLYLMMSWLWKHVGTVMVPLSDSWVWKPAPEVH